MKQNLTNVPKVNLEDVDHFYIVGCVNKDGILGIDNYKLDLVAAIQESSGAAERL